MRLLPLALLALLTAPAPPLCSAAGWAPFRAKPAAEGPVVFERKNVFDPSVPGEDWWIFKLANRIHIRTRERVVRHELLLPPDGSWDPLKAIETERNLRDLGFLRRAEVSRLDLPDGGTSLRVLTQDAWTLVPRFSVGTEGGEHFISYGAEEKNLLGLGKTVRFFHSESKNDRRNEARYVDPRFWGSWYRLLGHYAGTENGDEYGARVHRPFFSLSARSSMDVSWAAVMQEEVLFLNGDEWSKFLHDFRGVHGRIGLRVSRDPRLTQRVHAGVQYEHSRFSRTADTVSGTLPSERTLVGPVIGYSWVQPRYLKETEIDTMRRVEDFNLGNELSLNLTPFLDSWGSDRDRWGLTALNQQGLSLGPGRFALGQVGVRGRLAGDTVEDALFFANLNVFSKTRWPFPQTLIAHLEFNTSKRLDGERQLILGGNTGLRGYKNNSFTGGRTLLLNLEDRFFLDREILHLFYIGGVVFLDTGQAVAEGEALALEKMRLMARRCG